MRTSWDDMKKAPGIVFSTQWVFTKWQLDYHHVRVAQSCQILCDPTAHSLSGSSVRRIFQVRRLEWTAIPFSRESSRPSNQTQVTCIAGRFFTIWATRGAQITITTGNRLNCFHLKVNCTRFTPHSIVVPAIKNCLCFAKKTFSRTCFKITEGHYRQQIFAGQKRSELILKPSRNVSLFYHKIVI